MTEETEDQLRRLREKLKTSGYRGLSEHEKMLIAFVLTPGGCHASRR